jgi:hypothetical protein
MTLGQLLLTGAAISYMASAPQGYVVSSSADDRDESRADAITVVLTLFFILSSRI